MNFFEYTDFETAWSRYVDIIIGSDFTNKSFKISNKKKTVLKLLSKIKNKN